MQVKVLPQSINHIFLGLHNLI